MDQSSMDFWQNHSVRFLEMALRADKREILRQPDGYGKKTRECGDTVEIFLTVREGKIRSASFQTNGCLYAVACANAVVHMVEGKRLEDALALTPNAVVDYLETLPVEEKHCAELAISTLQLALSDAQEVERQPWKKFYPRT